jgi:uncharacterized protein (TIGR00730 family)
MIEVQNRDRQLNSPSYRLAALDEAFILSDSQRGLRFQLEYEKAEEVLRAWGILSSVVVFGSARVKEDGPSEHAAWYRQARHFGRLVSQTGGALSARHDGLQLVIATGGGPGLMEAANRGAYDVGAPNIGFNITLPHEQLPNPYTTPDLTFRFHYFAMRKMHIVMRARALVVFPGGFGTFDELFEILTLGQSGKMQPIVVILFDRKFWRSVVNFPYLVDAGLIKASDLDLFDFADSAEEACAIIHRKLPKEKTPT